MANIQVPVGESRGIAYSNVRKEDFANLLKYTHPVARISR
jgi:hypothetical protein